MALCKVSSLTYKGVSQIGTIGILLRHFVGAALHEIYEGAKQNHTDRSEEEQQRQCRERARQSVKEQ